MIWREPADYRKFWIKYTGGTILVKNQLDMFILVLILRFRSDLSRFNDTRSPLKALCQRQGTLTLSIRRQFGSPRYASSAPSQLYTLGWSPNHSCVCPFVLMYRTASRMLFSLSHLRASYQHNVFIKNTQSIPSEP